VTTESRADLKAVVVSVLSGYLLLAVAGLLLLASLGCCYESIERGVTAEEGLKYSVPAMRSNPTAYEVGYADKTEKGYRRMETAGDRSMMLACFCLVLSVGFGVAGVRSLRSETTTL